MTHRRFTSFRSLMAAVLLLAAAGAWTAHPFMHSPWTLAAIQCEADAGGSNKSDGAPRSAGPHSPHCQLCRMGDQAVSLTATPAEGPPLPVPERAPWIIAAEPIPSEPLPPGLSPRAPPSLV